MHLERTRLIGNSYLQKRRSRRGQDSRRCEVAASWGRGLLAASFTFDTSQSLIVLSKILPEASVRPSVR